MGDLKKNLSLSFHSNPKCSKELFPLYRGEHCGSRMSHETHCMVAAPM